MKHSFHVQVTVNGTTKSFHFRRTAVRIGRSPDNDLVLPDVSVGDHPCTLEMFPGDYGRHSFQLQAANRRPTTHENGGSVAIGRYGLTLVAGEPPGEREEEFLRRLQTDPADDQTRIVYCDWLEETGKTAAAAFLRAQLELTTAAPDSIEFRTAKETVHFLADGFPAHWRRIVARPPIENCGVRFELQCPKQWSSLRPTQDPMQRFCDACHKNVHYASTVPAARKLALAGQCVVVDVTQSRTDRDLEEEERHMLTGMIAPPSDWR